MLGIGSLLCAIGVGVFIKDKKPIMACLAAWASIGAMFVIFT